MIGAFGRVLTSCHLQANGSAGFSEVDEGPVKPVQVQSGLLAGPGMARFNPLP